MLYNKRIAYKMCTNKDMDMLQAGIKQSAFDMSYQWAWHTFFLQTILFSVVSCFFLLPGKSQAQVGKGAPPGLSERVLNQLTLLREEKNSRTPAQRKMNSQLVHAVKSRRGDRQLREMSKLKSNVDVAADNTTLVDIKAVVTPELLKKIEQLGGTVVNSYIEYEAVRARLSLDVIEQLAARTEVKNIQPASITIISSFLGILTPSRFAVFFASLKSGKLHSSLTSNPPLIIVGMINWLSSK